MGRNFRLAGAEAKPGERVFGRIRVARRLLGADCFLPLHLVAGARPGPTLGILAALHGDEVFPVAAFRELLRAVDPGELSGNLALVPVANPVAFASFSRQTPDQHDHTNLVYVFPGKPGGTLTERIAATLAREVLPGLDVLLEVHSGGIGRLQKRVEYDGRLPAELKRRTLELAFSFGCGLVHESAVPAGSPIGYFNAQGRLALQVEVGGPYLAGPEEDLYRPVLVRGVLNVMRHLKMVEGAPELPERQFWFPREGVRFEVNPSEGGYLSSRRGRMADLGVVVEKGEILGEMFDPYSYESLEELASPVRGVLFFTRLSGPVEAGNKGFAVARLEGGRWVRGLSLEG